MIPREIRKGIYAVGAIDWNREIFDELIPLPEGTTYNSYVVKGSEATALIDTVDPEKWYVLEDHLDRLGLDHLDYVIINHVEQDHSGSLPMVLEKYPMATVVTNAKCKGMLIDHHHITEDKFIVKGDGEILSLGDRTMETIIAPWVHWPETQLTYLREEKILFTCDLFGSHLATSDLYASNEEVYRGAKRYYAEIMMPFRHIIPKHVEKVSNMDIDIIAPSHGPLYDKPKFIIDAYKDWTSDKVKNQVIVPYVSMHGSTRKMVDHFIDALIDRGITVKVFDIPHSDIGELAMELVDAATVVIGTPTVLTGPHPSAVYAAFLANALRPKLKFATVIGSYGWGGKTVENICGLICNLKVEVLDPVIVKGLPHEGDYKALDDLADTIAQKHKDLGIL